MPNVCMVHRCKLNDNEECDICMEELIDGTDNSLEFYDDVDENGEEFDY